MPFSAASISLLALNLPSIGWNWLGWMLLTACAIASMALAMTIINLKTLGKAPRPTPIPLEELHEPGLVQPSDTSRPLISVCIPARNESANLEACVLAILANADALKLLATPDPKLNAKSNSNPLDNPTLEVIVYDDQSTDETPAILARLVALDPRVRPALVVSLPSGWNGKQHACWRMSQHARGSWLVFTDADVRFEPQCLASALTQAHRTKAALISAFPRQITGTLSESLVVPMIFFILLSYLPFPRMRRTNDPASSAGCGQFLLVRRDAYDATQGHQAFKDSMHDGIKMPRAIRKAGFHSDLVDGTPLLSCRMYRGFSQTWRGFAKNAYEGLGSVGLLLFITIMHAIGHMLPWAFLLFVLFKSLGLIESTYKVQGEHLGLAAAACLLALVQRVILAKALSTSMLGALLHPVGVLFMTLIQWHSYWLHLTGQRSWRGRIAQEASTPA